MHDLAMSMAQPEHITTSFQGNLQNNSKGIRYISFCDRNYSPVEVPNFLLESGIKKMRSIYFQFHDARPSISFADTCVSRLKFLRILDLTDSSFKMLPSSVSGLIHLRYLDLYSSKRLKLLPDSLCKLHNLQRLDLGGCLEFEKLPRDLGNLISLRDFSITTKERCLSRKAIRRLRSLRYLVIGECHNLQCPFDDDAIWMQRFTVLRLLVIADCENLLSLPRGLRCITTLEYLAICCCEMLDMKIDDDANQVGGGGGGVFGLSSLQYLELRDLPNLTVLPQWLFLQVDGTLNTNLKSIENFNCPNLSSLPKCLENLKSHQKLSIIGCPQLSAFRIISQS